jgi:hypothetical protein
MGRRDTGGGGNWGGDVILGVVETGAAVGGPSSMQRAHGAIALALGRKRYSACGSTGLGTVPMCQYSFPIHLLLQILKNTKVVPPILHFFPNFSKW